MSEQKHLPERTEFYLSRNGLPKEGIMLVSFYKPEEFRAYRHGGESYTIVGGGDCGGYIAVDQAGAVFSVPREDGEPEVTRFVASSLEQFVMQLNMYQGLAAAEGAGELDEMQLHAAAGDLAERLFAIDENALNDSEGFWPLILEQVAAGLL